MRDKSLSDCHFVEAGAAWGWLIFFNLLPPTPTQHPHIGVGKIKRSHPPCCLLDGPRWDQGSFSMRKSYLGGGSSARARPSFQSWLVKILQYWQESNPLIGIEQVETFISFVFWFHSERTELPSLSISVSLKLHTYSSLWPFFGAAWPLSSPSQYFVLCVSFSWICWYFCTHLHTGVGLVWAAGGNKDFEVEEPASSRLCQLQLHRLRQKCVWDPWSQCYLQTHK